MGQKTKEPSVMCQLVSVPGFAMLITAAIMIPIGYSASERSKLVNPRNFFVEIEEGCNISDIKKVDNDCEGKGYPSETYTSYSFYALTNPPMYYQSKPIITRSCGAREDQKSTLRWGSIIKCWRFLSPNPLSKLTDAERKEVTEEYDCYNKDCAKIIDPDSYYTKLLHEAIALIVGIAVLAGGLLLLLISVAVFCPPSLNKSNHKGQSRSNPVAAVAHTTDRNEKSKTKKDTKRQVKTMQLVTLR